MRFLVPLLLLIAALFFVVGAGEQQNITVRGQTICRRRSVKGLHVELREHDTFDPDDSLSATTTGPDGTFEYAVALFVYMRILGYPASQISILTTYNGQTSLLRDVVQRRCAQNPLLGVPAKISTVDRYQGQQNDYIILSLVRTKAVGHLRDVRRLIVALSRARLGLYIFARVPLFSRCYELFPAFQRLLQKPTHLFLLPNEQYSMENGRMSDQKPSMEPMEIMDTQHMSHFVSEYYKSNADYMRQRDMPESVEPEGEDVEMETDTAVNNQIAPLTQQAGQMSVDEQGQQAAGQETLEAAPQPSQPQGPQENDEGAIVFEQVDFERLQEVPKY